jgi:uncharacterized sulfatase
MYDAEIAYTDEMIGRLIDWIDERQLGDTVVIVTADHGELFGEYGLLSHKFVLHDAVIRVPLVIKGLYNDLAVDADDLVQHVDVMKTLLNLAGADTDGVLGYDLRSDRREFAISQRGPSDFQKILDHNSEWDHDRFHEGLLTALRTDGWKYQKSGRESELFDLPDESMDVSSTHTELAGELDVKLDSWMEKHGQPIGESQEADFSNATKRQLRELGYID